MKIDKQHIVAIHYTLKNSEGEVVDSSSGEQPLRYLHGANTIIKGLEKALHGKVIGDTFEVTVEPEQAYGPIIDELVQQVDLDMLPNDQPIEVGMVFQTQSAQGQPLSFYVMSVDDNSATLDGNHPLAGQVLHFSGYIEDVRLATDDDLQPLH